MQNFKDMLLDWEEYYNKPEYDDRKTTKVFSDLMDYIYMRFNESLVTQIDEAVKEYQSARYGYPDIAIVHKAVSEYEKRNNVSLQKKTGYYSSETIDKDEVKKENKKEVDMKDFRQYFADLLNHKRFN